MNNNRKYTTAVIDTLSTKSDLSMNQFVLSRMERISHFTWNSSSGGSPDSPINRSLDKKGLLAVEITLQRNRKYSSMKTHDRKVRLWIMNSSDAIVLLLETMIVLTMLDIDSTTTDPIRELHSRMDSHFQQTDDHNTISGSLCNVRAQISTTDRISFNTRTNHTCNGTIDPFMKSKHSSTLGVSLNNQLASRRSDMDSSINNRITTELSSASWSNRITIISIVIPLNQRLKYNGASVNSPSMHSTTHNHDSDSRQIDSRSD